MLCTFRLTGFHWNANFKLRLENVMFALKKNEFIPGCSNMKGKIFCLLINGNQHYANVFNPLKRCA